MPVSLSVKNSHHQTEKNYEYEKSFVESNLIAYIGNKRRLLPMILSAIKAVEENGSTPINRQGKFIDFFSGTGVVARLAKSLGFAVQANDWEYYSYCINRGFLELEPNDLKLFDPEGGIKSVLKKLNALKKESLEAYISKYYCPKNDLAPDADRERMFYTHQNGVLIDNIRQAIEELYPKNDEVDEKKRNLLLALLLIQASKRSNTSGVFKGFHYGFGGSKGDALSRILSPVCLEPPILAESENHAQVFCEDALELAKTLENHTAEIAYLDPPYNQHQYGSNYHLLNTIAKNDKPSVNESFWVEGKKKDKSAIRKDWKKTASGFCRENKAVKDFTQLVERVNAKYILVSYSDEGFIPLDEMIQILAAKGKISVVTSSYVRYRGGKQSNTTVNKNIEFVLIVESAFLSTDEDIEAVKKVFFTNSLNILLEDMFPLHHFKSEEVIVLGEKKAEKGYKVFWREFGLELYLNHQLILTEGSRNLISRLPEEKKKKLIEELQLLRPQTNHEKTLDIIEILEHRELIDRKYLLAEMVRYYNKVNQKKEPILFEELTKKILKLNQQSGWLEENPRIWEKFLRTQVN